MKGLAEKLGWKPMRLSITEEQQDKARERWVGSVKAEEEF